MPAAFKRGGGCGKGRRHRAMPAAAAAAAATVSCLLLLSYVDLVSAASSPFSRFLGAISGGSTTLGGGAVMAGAMAGTNCAMPAVFGGWMLKHNKTYPNKQEAEVRCQYFNDALSYMTSYATKNPKAPFKMGLNEFTDWDPSELQYLYGAKPAALGTVSDVTFRDMDEVDPATLTDVNKLRTYGRRELAGGLPKLVDYRNDTKNPYLAIAVTLIKNQGRCASSYAQSATALLEGQLALSARGPSAMRNLSTQQLLDCSKDYGNIGCKGGSTDEALEYAAKGDGLRVEDDYAYRAKEQGCSTAAAPYAKTLGAVALASCRDPSQIMKALYYTGPVSVYIKADCKAFQHYTQGVLDDDCITGRRDAATCYNSVNLAALVVGYGTDEATGLDYWLIKNSWGTTWGEDGYLRIKRGAGDCDLGCVSAFPVTARNTTLFYDRDGSGNKDGGGTSGTTGGETSDKGSAGGDGGSSKGGDDAAKAVGAATDTLKDLDIDLPTVIGLGVGGAVVILAICVACICCCMRKHDKH